jgi:hypothetical protein
MECNPYTKQSNFNAQKPVRELTRERLSVSTNFFLKKCTSYRANPLRGVGGSKGPGFDNPWKGEVVVSQRLSACVLEYWSIGRKEITGNR